MCLTPGVRPNEQPACREASSSGTCRTSHAIQAASLEKVRTSADYSAWHGGTIHRWPGKTAHFGRHWPCPSSAKQMTEESMKKLIFVPLAIIVIAAATIGGCSRTMTGGPQDLATLAQSRNLSPEDAAHALKTFVPPGGRDEYLLFASGGHSGQVHVIGVPSMRLLKTIAVFTPEPWQGYGYGADWSETALGGRSEERRVG